MRGIDITGTPEGYVATAALVLFFISCAARVWLFLKPPLDRNVQELLDDASIIGFPDTLAFRLAYRWKKLKIESRTITAAFVLPYFGFILGLPGAVLSAYLRA